MSFDPASFDGESSVEIFRKAQQTIREARAARDGAERVAALPAAVRELVYNDWREKEFEHLRDATDRILEQMQQGANLGADVCRARLRELQRLAQHEGQLLDLGDGRALLVKRATGTNEVQGELFCREDRVWRPTGQELGRTVSAQSHFLARALHIGGLVPGGPAHERLRLRAVRGDDMDCLVEERAAGGAWRVTERSVTVPLAAHARDEAVLSPGKTVTLTLRGKGHENWLANEALVGVVLALKQSRQQQQCVVGLAVLGAGSTLQQQIAVTLPAEDARVTTSPVTVSSDPHPRPPPGARVCLLVRSTTGFTWRARGVVRGYGCARPAGDVIHLQAGAETRALPRAAVTLERELAVDELLDLAGDRLVPGARVRALLKAPVLPGDLPGGWTEASVVLDEAAKGELRLRLPFEGEPGEPLALKEAHVRLLSIEAPDNDAWLLRWLRSDVPALGNAAVLDLRFPQRGEGRLLVEALPCVVTQEEPQHFRVAVACPRADCALLLRVERSPLAFAPAAAEARVRTVAQLEGELADLALPRSKRGFICAGTHVRVGHAFRSDEEHEQLQELAAVGAEHGAVAADVAPGHADVPVCFAYPGGKKQTSLLPRGWLGRLLTLDLAGGVNVPPAPQQGKLVEVLRGQHQGSVALVQNAGADRCSVCVALADGPQVSDEVPTADLWPLFPFARQNDEEMAELKKLGLPHKRLRADAPVQF